MPTKAMLLRPDGGPPDFIRLAEFTRYQRSIDGKATAYVCHNHNCKFPTTDVDAMLRSLAAVEP